MVTATDFGATHLQATVFTPDFAFSHKKVLTYLLTRYGDEFDGEPSSINLPVIVPVIVPDMPLVTLRSQDGLYRLQASAGKVDVLRDWHSLQSEATMREFYVRARDILQDYVLGMNTRTARLACVAHRVTLTSEPAREISRHFCREVWYTGAGPLNRPSSFEMHALKQFEIPGLFTVNSWFRCKSGMLNAVNDKNEKSESPVIIVQQDINTPSEIIDSRAFSESETSEFFHVVPIEMSKVLELYFPSLIQANENGVR